jgi:hypothetical protein
VVVLSNPTAAGLATYNVIRKRNEAGLKHEEIPLHYVIIGGTLPSLRAHDLSEGVQGDAHKIITFIVGHHREFRGTPIKL